MTKAAIVILAGTEHMSDTGRLVNGLEAAREFREAGDEIELIFDGAATQWVGELESEGHPYHDLYLSVKDEIEVCEYCVGAFEQETAVSEAGVGRRDEHDGHPSIRSLVEDGYEVITF